MLQCRTAELTGGETGGGTTGGFFCVASPLPIVFDGAAFTDGRVSCVYSTWVSSYRIRISSKSLLEVKYCVRPPCGAVLTRSIA